MGCPANFCIRSLGALWFRLNIIGGSMGSINYDDLSPTPPAHPSSRMDWHLFKGVLGIPSMGSSADGGATIHAAGSPVDWGGSSVLTHLSVPRQHQHQLAEVGYVLSNTSISASASAVDSVSQCGKKFTGSEVHATPNRPSFSSWGAPRVGWYAGVPLSGYPTLYVTELSEVLICACIRFNLRM